MNPKIKEIAEEAGFVFWQDESWGPGPGHIDWSAIYDKEFQSYTELLINECVNVMKNRELELYQMTDMTETFEESFKEHFGIEE